MKNMGILPRTFLKTLGILGMIIIIVHVIIYFTFPVFYVEKQRNKLRENAEVFVKYLEQKDSREIPGLLESYSKNLGISVHLKDDVDKGKSPIIHDLQIDKDNDVNYIIIEEKTIKTKDNKTLEVQFVSGTNVLTEAVDIALLYLPFTLISTLIFCFIFSYFYSKKLVEPLLYIAKTTKKMQNMESDARFNEKNKGELGEVGSQIDRVYSKLLATIKDLETKNKNIIELQEQKVAFLRGASHELKTPLAGIRIILENMKYNVGRYKDHDKYLSETIVKIDSLNILLREILESSKFQEWTRNKQVLNIKGLTGVIIERHRELYLAKNISIHNDVEETTTIFMSIQALDKILSNVISNAIKYSPKDGDVYIYDKDGYLIIDNPCPPLNKESLDNLFKIFYHSQVVNKSQNGTGLGLYIVKNILESYKLEYSFKPYEQGMRFKIKLTNKNENKENEEDEIE
ncbi:sensor histidine kinase [Gemella cuniculi]